MIYTEWNKSVRL